MPSNQPNKTRIVGDFIRKRREALGLSQKSLGQLFDPPVTTQFISNVERGVTPLPPVHVSILAQALKTSEEELTYLMEKEYSSRLSRRVTPGANGNDVAAAGNGAADGEGKRVPLWVHAEDCRWLETIYAAIERLDQARKEAFRSLCAKFLNVSLEPLPAKSQQRATSREPQ